MNAMVPQDVPFKSGDHGQDGELRQVEKGGGGQGATKEVNNRGGGGGV